MKGRGGDIKVHVATRLQMNTENELSKNINEKYKQRILDE